MMFDLALHIAWQVPGRFAWWAMNVGHYTSTISN